jgi:lipopolysaccharide export system protein LptC
MVEVTKIQPIATNRARLRLQSPRPRPLAELATSSYSSFVGTMKIVLPAIATGLILMVVIWPQLRSPEETFRPGFATNISPEDVENIRMAKPRYQGVDKRAEPFTVTAKSAVKSQPSSDVWELDSPQADITLSRGNWVALRADYGAYREQDQQLDLIGSVNLYHDAGYEFRTLSAHVDLRNNTAEGDDPVDGQGPFGEIHSQGFRIYDQGERVLFTGKSHLLLRPRATDGIVGRG